MHHFPRTSVEDPSDWYMCAPFSQSASRVTISLAGSKSRAKMLTKAHILLIIIYAMWRRSSDG